MSKDYADVDVDPSAETVGGLPKTVTVVDESGPVATARYTGIRDRGVNGEEAVYEFVDTVADDVAVLTENADAAYVGKRVAEQLGYQESVDIGVDELDALETQTEQYSGEDAVQGLMDSDELDSL
jgi:hypothetical protein